MNPFDLFTSELHPIPEEHRHENLLETDLLVYSLSA